MNTTMMQAATAEELLAAKNRAMSPTAYHNLLEQVVAEGRTTGPDQGEDMVNYTKLNLARTNRAEKTTELQPELLEVLEGLPEMYWLVLTEAWCGDSSMVTPVLAMMAEHSPRVGMGILLRDQHTELMEKYLTGGARSIPKLIAFDTRGNELFTYGPRPQEAQQIMLGNKALPKEQQLDPEALHIKINQWYNADKGQSIQREMLELLKAV